MTFGEMAREVNVFHDNLILYRIFESRFFRCVKSLLFGNML